MINKRTVEKKTRLSQEESDLLGQLAERSGYSESTIIRQSLLRTLEDPELYNSMFGFNPIRMVAIKRMTKYRKPA